MDAVGLGALNLDIIYKVNFEEFTLIKKGVERKIDKEELPFLKKFLKEKAQFVTKSGGGSAANTIYALSRMGFSCGFVGKVGKDEEGDFLLQELKEAKIDTSRVLREGQTGICFILIDEKGERSVFVLPGTNDTLLLSEIDIDYINRAKILHTASFIGDTSYKTQKETILRAKPLLSFDPGEPHAARGWEELFPIMRKTHILFSTKKEIELITGKNLKEGSFKIKECGVKVVVCKLGENGSLIINGGREVFIPAQKVKSIDTTGAGDVYAAGFLAGFLNNLTLKDCGVAGTLAAALSITGYGRERYPEKNFLESVLKKLREKNAF